MSENDRERHSYDLRRGDEDFEVIDTYSTRCELGDCDVEVAVSRTGFKDLSYCRKHLLGSCNLHPLCPPLGRTPKVT